MDASAEPLTQRRILGTWAPLAASWALMGLELPLVAAVLARLDHPEVSLAAYGIVFSLSIFIEGPIIMLLAASTALSRNWDSYALIRRFMTRSSLVLTAVHALVAFTPLFDLVVGDLLHAPEAVREPARVGMQIMTPWTAAIAFRRFQQGVLIRFGHARAVGFGTLTRLGANALVLGIGAAAGGAPGYVLGPLAVVCGVLAEATFAGLWVRPVVRHQLRPAPPLDTPLTQRAFLSFYIPLALTPLITLAAQPIIAAGLGRMPRPIESLAVLPVVNGLSFLFRSMGFSYNEVVVAHLDEPGAYPALRRFAIVLGSAVVGALFLLAATPLGTLYLSRVSGLEPNLVDLGSRGLWIIVAMPGLAVALHFFQGILVHAGRTIAVTEAVVGNLLATVSVLAAGVAVGSVTGLYVGLAAHTAANLAQAGWLAWRSRPLRRGEPALPRPADAEPFAP